MTDFITQIDFNILNAIQSIRNPFLDTIMPLITFLGSGGIVWAVTALIMLCFKKSRKTGIVIIVSLLLGLFLSTMGLKNVIARERPYNTEGALLTVENLLIGAPSGRFFRFRPVTQYLHFPPQRLFCCTAKNQPYRQLFLRL